MTRFLILTGTAVIFVASLLYASLPPQIVLPVATASDPSTWPNTHLPRQRFAGTFGLIGDVLLITGAFRAARQANPLFWTGTALATFFFVGFDAITARLLDQTPTQMMPVMREMMSLTFLAGLVTFAIAAFNAPIWPRLSKTGGAVILAAACLWFVIPVPPLIFGIALFTALILIFAAGLQTALSTRAFT